MDSKMQQVDVGPFDGGFITYQKPWLLPDSGFQKCENALIYRGRLIKRPGHKVLGFLGPKITAEAVGALGATTYAHNYVNFPVVPFTVTVTDTVSVLDDNGNGAFWQPAVAVTGITKAANGIVTAVAHGYTAGDTVNFFSVGGMDEVNTVPKQNFQPFTVLAPVAANTFGIGDTTTFTAYTAGGVVRKNAGAINYTTGVSTIVFAVVTAGAVTTTYRYSTHNPVMGLCTRLISDTTLEQLIAFDTVKAYLYSASLQEFNDVSGATVWTGTNSDFFWPLNYQNSFWVTNGVDPIRYYISGTTWTNFTPTLNGAVTLQKAKMMFAYKGFMIVLGTQEGGIKYNQRARWSRQGGVYVTAPVPTGFAAVATSWDDSSIGKGGAVDAGTSEDIISAALYKDILIVFFEFSTWRLRFTGSNQQPFAWERINSQYGSESQFSSVPFDGGVLTVSSSGIVGADFNTVQRIDEKIPNTAFEIENNPVKAANKRVHGIRDFEKQLVYWCYPDFQDTSSEDYPNKVLCYNYLENCWSIFDQNFTCFGQFTTASDITWAQLTNAWKSYNQTWDSFYIQSGVPTVVAGSSDGQVFELNTSTVDQSDFSGTTANFGFEVITKDYNPFYKAGKTATLRYVDFYFMGTIGGEFTVDFFLNDDLSTPILSKIVSTHMDSPDTSRQWNRVYVNLNADFVTMKLYLTDAQIADSIKGAAPWEMEGWNMYFVWGGRL